MSVNKSGYIYKEGEKVLSWKKRYMTIEIENGRMSYYTKDNKKERKGEILLKTIKDVRIEKNYKNKQFVFGIHTTIGRTYYIQGSDDENVVSWVESINEAINPSKTGSFPQADQPPPSPTSNGSQTIPRPVQQQPSQPRQQTVDDFIKLKVIGRGGFGRVLLVRKKDSGKVYAMKILKKSVIAARGEIEHTRTEKSVLARVDSPFLAKLHFSFQTDDNLFLVMDFINGGELFFHLSNEKRFSEDRTKFYSAQIVAGIEYLHNLGVIYRDLKPENLLLSAQGNIVMTDFGLSKQGLEAKDARTATFCGTPEYLAPEIIKGEEYTKAIDWWSVGTIIYEMLTGLPPFYTDDEEHMYTKIMTAELVFPNFLSPEVIDIISKFLKRNPNERLQQPEEIKSHPWFSTIDWDKLMKLEIVPPFKPNVKSVDDTSQIDDDFLNEDINENDDDAGPKAEVSRDAFVNFTYMGK